MFGKRVPLEKKSAKPLHDQIYEAVRNDLLAGVYKTGQKMPTTPSLLTRYKVNSSTLQRAMNRLVKEGYIERSPRRGTFVKNKPQGARVALLVERDLLAPASEFSRVMVKQLQDSSSAFGWSLEVFDCAGQSSPGHQKKIAAAFRYEYQQHPFRGLIELNVSSQAKSITTDADNLCTSGLGPNAGAEAVDLDLDEMASSCMAWYKKRGVNDLYAIRNKGGIPFGSEEKTALKKEAKAAEITLKFIDISNQNAAAGLSASTFHHAKLALKNSGEKAGFLCSEQGAAQGIAEAAMSEGVEPASILVSASETAPRYLIPFSVYHFPVADLAEAILSQLDEKMHANRVEEPKPIKGKLIPAVQTEKSPPNTELKKAWKP